MSAPEAIDDFEVLGYGYLQEPSPPTGYIPPADGSSALEPVQNVAICRVNEVAGYYLLFCTPDWKLVTYQFNETMEATRRGTRDEFGREVIEWRARA
jgi:hypothetical protein